MRLIFLLMCALSIGVAGCGTGLAICGDVDCDIAETVAPSPVRLVLSGLAATTRKNDCSELTVRAKNAEDENVDSITASVSLSATSGVEIYNSLSGCQKYDSSAEQTTFFLAPNSPEATFYVRPDVTGDITISATASLSDITSDSAESTVSFSAFDNAEGASDSVSGIVRDSSGKLYIRGSNDMWDDTFVGRIARLNNDGTLDTTFVPTGTGLTASVSALAPLSNGKLVIAGSFTTYNGISTPRMARLNSDGSLDTSFAPTGTGLGAAVTAMVALSNGQFLVGGSFTTYNTATTRRYVARINADGTLDAGFTQTGTGLSSAVRALGLQSDGKIIVGGIFNSYNGTSRPYIARLNTDGSLDVTFATTGTGLSGSVDYLQVQSDDKIIVVGAFTNYNGSSRPYIARLNADGTLDTSYVQTGTGFNGVLNRAYARTDGKIFVAGNFTSYNSVAARGVALLNSDGSLDTTFAPTGTGFDGNGSDLAFEPDGRITAVGSFRSFNGTSTPRVIRVNTDGSIDSTFSFAGKPGGLNHDVVSLVGDEDGKIFIGGTFSTHGATQSVGAARLNSDGTLDTSFVLPGIGLNGSAQTFAARSDQKVIVGGSFTTFNGASKPYILRLNADATLDNSFAVTGTGFNGTVVRALIQADGKILVGGSFNNYNSASRGGVALLNSDGTVDTSYVPTGTGLNGTVMSMEQQTDGKLVVAGTFTSYNGTAAPYVARLNADGTLDPGFAPTGTGLNGSVNSLDIQADGKILVAGTFTSYNGTNRNYLARLNADGSLDTGFVPSASVNLTAYSVHEADDGKIWVGGGGPGDAGYIYRLEADGTLDSDFTTPTFHRRVRALLPIATTNKIVAGGSFYWVGTSTTNQIARFTYNGTLD